MVQEQTIETTTDDKIMKVGKKEWSIQLQLVTFKRLGLIRDRVHFDDI